MNQLTARPPFSPPFILPSAFFNMVKSIFADTNLVVAGTVLTLAFSLAAEDGAGPRRLVGSISGALGLVGYGYGSPEDGGLKEL